jgi:chemotaxis protein methyltransferase WspC
VIDPRLSALLRETCGMALESLGEAVVRLAVESRSRALGVDTAAYPARVLGDARELDEFVEELVVPETWFFRDGGPFTFLADHARRRAEEGRPVQRVLSVPCSTGEEAYSIALTLLDALPAAATWRVDALDISARALRRAAEGRYRSSVLRGTPGALRGRYFREQAGVFEVEPALRSRVHFARGNALSLPRPGDAGAYDVIFCRNLFIYLSTEARARLARALHGMLRPGGVLLMGHADSIAEGLGWARVGPPSAFAHAHAAPGEVSPVARLASLLQASPAPPASPTLPAAPRVVPVARPPSSPPGPRRTAPVEGAAAGLGEARRLADRGELQAAVERCEEHLENNPLDAAGHCLLGVVQGALGRRSVAADCFRRALYLDPHHDESLALLALLADARGDARLAANFRRRRAS